MVENAREQGAFDCLWSIYGQMELLGSWLVMLPAREDIPELAEKFDMSSVQTQEGLRRIKCHVRVLQAILEAARQHEEPEHGVTEEDLSELTGEAITLYDTIETILEELSDEDCELISADHPILRYLSSPGAGSLEQAGAMLVIDGLRTMTGNFIE
jgi:hypothetical protein